MVKRSRLLLFIGLGLWMAVIIQSVIGQMPQAAAMDVTLVSGKVSVSAHDVPLEDLLKVLGEKGGVTLKTSPAMDEPVTFNFVGITVAEAIKRLLVGWNYALFFRKPVAGQAGEYMLWIFEKKDGEQRQASALPLPVSQEPGGHPPPPITMSRAEYKKLFADARDVERQLFAEPPVDSPTEFAGILVFDVKPNSGVAALGIAEGDLITDVNGTPIHSAENFAKMLNPQTFGEKPMVMIHLIRKDKSTAPINIYLQD